MSWCLHDTRSFVQIPPICICPGDHYRKLELTDTVSFLINVLLQATCATLLWTCTDHDLTNLWMSVAWFPTNTLYDQVIRTSQRLEVALKVSWIPLGIWKKNFLQNINLFGEHFGSDWVAFDDLTKYASLWQWQKVRWLLLVVCFGSAR